MNTRETRRRSTVNSWIKPTTPALPESTGGVTIGATIGATLLGCVYERRLFSPETEAEGERIVEDPPPPETEAEGESLMEDPPSLEGEEDGKSLVEDLPPLESEEDCEVEDPPPL
jgi:hypothetical protein